MDDIRIAEAASQPDAPTPFAEVLRAEMKVVLGHELPTEIEARKAVDTCGTRVAALCLSGGGIRSATFALGVLQGLARFGLLGQFHYLSSVSGGGYIASWLSMWRHRVADGDIVDSLNASLETGEEAREIVGIRKDSNYLTPTLGLLSADTWTLVALYVRNLLLNWIMFVPFFMGVLAFPRICASALAWIAGLPAEPAFNFARVLGCLFVFIGLAVGVYGRFRKEGNWLTNARYLQWSLGPLVLSAASFTAAAVIYGQNQLTFPDHGLWYRTGIGCGAGIYFAAWLLGRFLSFDRTDVAERPIEKRDVVFWTLSGALVGYLIAVGMRLVVDSFCSGSIAQPTWIAVTLGLSGSVLAYLAGELLYVGLASGARKGDMDREWLARSSGWLTAAAVSWALFSAISLYAPGVLRDLIHDVYTKIAAAFALGVPGFIAAALGWSGRTGATKAAQAVKTLSPMYLASGAAVIFALFAACLLALLVELLECRWLADASTNVTLLVVDISLMVGLILLATLLSTCININRFSLHALYRHRLVRAFLGSARAPERKPDPFTGFDPKDNRTLAEVVPRNPDRLFHVINAALNVVSSDNPAWQERKAESFTMTRLYCGNPYVGYRPTERYGGHSPPKEQPGAKGGITLGTAMAISGAAVSPNQGYNSSPLVGFLLMLFNVRLGWWLANPARRGYSASGPRFSLSPALRELAGDTTDRSKWIYLSDGGHFENLGLYEMVRRRCRMIVVSDAGCDPKCTFEDLGNAVRKVFIDFGVSIDFERLFIKPRQDPPTPGIRFAVGTIKYPGCEDPGWLLYIKPTYLGTERADVRSYASGSREFPHESTTDQWFSESQLEAYRALGASIIELICNDGKKLPAGDAPRQLDLATLETLAHALLKRESIDLGLEPRGP